MALAHRVIPVVLCRGRQMIKGRQFKSWRSVGLAEQAVRVHQARGVDELVLLDIDATKNASRPDLSLIEQLTDQCRMPIAVGGGVQTEDDVKALLRAGADKVVIGSALWNDVGLLHRLVDRFGGQAIVASIDYAGTRHYVCSGTVPAASDVATWCRIVAHQGVGEILLTSIEREGTMLGYDLTTIRCVAREIDCPLVVNGGAGSYKDMLQAIRQGANAVAAGALFQFTDSTPREASAYLQSQGIEARI